MEEFRPTHHPVSTTGAAVRCGVGHALSSEGPHAHWAPMETSRVSRGDDDERSDGQRRFKERPVAPDSSSGSPHNATVVSVADESEDAQNEDLASTVPARTDDLSQTSATPREASRSSRSRRRRVRRLLIGLHVLELLALVGVCATTQVRFSPFDIHHTAADVVVVDAIRASIILLCMVLGSVRAVAVAQLVNALVLLAPLTGKLWIYDGWSTKDSAVASTVVVLAPVVAAITFAGCWRIRAMDDTAQASLRFSAIFVILRPYFLPRSHANKFLMLVTLSALLTSKACGIVAPIFLGKAVSDITAQPRRDPSGNVGWFVLLQFASRLCTEVQDLCFYKIMQAAYVETTEVAFRHLHSLSLEWHLRKKVGHAMRSMTRGLQAAENVMVYLVLNLIPTLGAALASFVVFAVEFDAREVAAVCHIGLAVYCWATYVLTLWRRHFNEQLNDYDNILHESATDSLVNVETVKYFGSEGFELQRVVRRAVRLQRANFKTQAAEFVVQTSQNGVIQLSMLGALLLSAHAILNSHRDVGAGEFVAIQTYVLTIFSPLTYLGYMYSMVITSLVGMQDLTSLLNEQADVVDRPDAKPLHFPPGKGGDGCEVSTEPLKTDGDAKPCLGSSVSFENVTFRYPSQLPEQGLHGVSFTIPAGTTTAVVGATGSGKTTLSRLLFRFYDVLDGRITIDGQDIAAVTQASLRQTVGMVPQDTCMFNDTIRYNIAYGKPDATDEEVRKAAEQARIVDFVEGLAEGWDTPVGERGLKLSGGEKQRVAIARCLLKNPPIVVLDEATSALDNSTERDVQAALQALEGRTALVIAHRLTTVQHADQIVVLRKGRVAEVGTHSELLANPDSEYSALWMAQQHGCEEEDDEDEEAGGTEEDDADDRATLVSCDDGCSPTSTLCQRVAPFKREGDPLADWSAEPSPSLLHIPLRPKRVSRTGSTSSSIPSRISEHCADGNLDTSQMPLVPVLVTASSSASLKERASSFPYNQTLSHRIC